MPRPWPCPSAPRSTSKRAHDGLARACYAAGHRDEARQHWEFALDLYAGSV